MATVSEEQHLPCMMTLVAREKIVTKHGIKRLSYKQQTMQQHLPNFLDLITIILNKVQPEAKT